MEIILILVGLPVLLVLWAVALYNKLVKLKNMAEEGWSGIEVQLKRRANLIPNLLETVKGYMGHEQEVLENVTRYRAGAAEAGAAGDRGQA